MRTMTSVLLLVGLAGCSLHARSTDDYRKVTRDLVASRQVDLDGCYERALAADQDAGGDVAVAFQVEAKTGTLHSPALVPERTTASEELGQCVVAVLDGLVLDPPDRRTAEAEFVWTFSKG